MPIIAAHRAAQGGRGSGYDVAACLVGGVTIFTPGPGTNPPRVERIGWPEGALRAPSSRRAAARRRLPAC
ncbi:MAG: hypothetical protein U1F43_24125 [Myxococcota bacterium]